MVTRHTSHVTLPSPFVRLFKKNRPLSTTCSTSQQAAAAAAAAAAADHEESAAPACSWTDLKQGKQGAAAAAAAAHMQASAAQLLHVVTLVYSKLLRYM